MKARKYFTEEERIAGSKAIKKAYALRNKERVKLEDRHVKLKTSTYDILIKYKDDNNLRHLTIDRLFRSVMRRAGLIKTQLSAKDGIPQLKGRYDETK